MEKKRRFHFNKKALGVLIVAATALYLLASVALAQVSPKTSTNTSYSYTADPLSWGDVYAFDEAAFNGTNYSKINGTTTNKSYYNNSSQDNSGAGTWAMPAYVGKVTYGNHAAPSNVTAMTSHTAAQFRSGVTMSTVEAPIDSSVTIPVATTTGTGVYSVVPGSTGTYVVYVYSPNGAPSNVKYALLKDYTSANAYTGSAGTTALTFTQIGSTGWYYSNNINVDNLGWYCYKPNVVQSNNTTNSGDTGTGTNTGGVLSNTTLTSTTYYHNTWSAEQVNLDTVLCISFPSSVQLGPITKADGTFSLTNDNSKGSVSVRNIFGVDVTTSYSGVHIPLFISATPSTSEYSFTGVDGGSVSVVRDGLYRFDFEATAALTAKWEKFVDLPTVTVNDTTLDAYFTSTGSTEFPNGTDTTYTFTADFSNAVSGATLSYAVTGSTTGIDTSGTLTAGSPSFSIVASFDSVTVTFTASGDGVTKTMTYTITGTCLQNAARIGTTSGTNEFKTLEDALVASNNGTSGDIYMIGDYKMYNGDHPKTAWLQETNGVQKRWYVKSGVTLVVPDGTDTTVITNSNIKNHYVAYGTSNPISEYRRLTLTSGVTITVAGSVSVASRVAQDGNAHAQGPYGLIYMDAGSHMTFNNGSKLYCFGFIKGDGSIDTLSGSAVYEILKVEDYPGGASNVNSLKNAGAFPFSKFSVQNIAARLTIHSGSTLDVFYTLYGTSAGWNTCWVRMIDSLSSSNSALFKSDDSVMFAFINGRQYVELYGNSKVSALSISMYITVSTSDLGGDLIPYNFTITVKPGCTTDLGESMLLSKGSELNVDQGGKVTVGSGKKLVVLANADDPQAVGTQPDAKVDINGTIEVSGDFVTSNSVAKVISSEHTGKVVYTKAPTASSTVKIKKSSTEAASVTVIPVKLQNGDETLVDTAPAQNGWTFNYDPDYLQWYRYLVSFQLNGNTVGKGFYNYDSDPATYDASWLTDLSATVTSGGATVAINDGVITATGVTADTTITISGVVPSYTPIFVLDESQYAAYHSFTGNEITDTETVNGKTVYVLQRAASEMEVGVTLTPPSNASLGVDGTNPALTGFFWNMSGTRNGGDGFLGVVPVGGANHSDVYIYGFYTGYVAYNSFTEEYYDTLQGAMRFIADSTPTTITLFANCGTFVEEDASALLVTTSASSTSVIDLNGFKGVGRIVNNGNMTITDTSASGGGSLSSSYYQTGSGITSYAATVRNNTDATLTITNVGIHSTQMGSVYNGAIFNNGGSIPQISNVSLSSGYGYNIWNYGGTIGTIENCTMTGSYGINNRNIRAGAIASGYSISKVGTIDTINNCEINVGQYAIYNGGVINTMSNSTFVAAPDSAQVDTLGNGLASARHGDVQCYTVYNSYNWWYDTNVWKQVDSSSGGYTRVNYYREEEQYRPTIGTITNCEIYAENTSTSASYGYALYNTGGVIDTISGTTTIKSYKHPDNAKISVSHYAMQNLNGGIIKSIEGTVNVSCTGVGAVYNDAAFTTQINYTYANKVGGNITYQKNTYGEPSTINSITCSGTWSCGGSSSYYYALMNSGYIGAINSTGLTLTGGYNVLYNATGSANSTSEITKKYTDGATASTEYERDEHYEKNLEKGSTIGTINGITVTGKGSQSYYPFNNQGHIGTVSNVTVNFAEGATANTSYYVAFLNGDSRYAELDYTIRTNRTSSTDPLLTVSAGVVTRYDRDYTYATPTIDVIDNLTVDSMTAYALRNAGHIGELKNSTITGTQYALHNSASGPYTERQTLQYYSGTGIFTTSKYTSEYNKHYKRDPASIDLIDNCTITTPANTYAMKNSGHVGTIKNSDLQAGTTTAKAYALANMDSTEREYTLNLEDYFYVSANAATACTAYWATNGETKVVTYDYDAPTIDLIGEGNTFKATSTVIANTGIITAIDSGEGTLTTVTGSSAKGSSIYNYSACLDARTTTTPYTAAASAGASGTAGTAVNSDTLLSGATIGTIKNVYINANGYGILNGDASAGKTPTIGEIGEGTEIYAHCTTAGYHAIYNQANAKVAKISGGVYTTTTATTNAYRNNNTDPALVTVITGGDFKGMAVGRANAIFEPDNTSRQTYGTAEAPKVLSANSRSVNFNNGTNVAEGTGYYYICDPVAKVEHVVSTESATETVTTFYASLAAAVAAAQDGDTVTMLADETLSALVDFNGKSVTLDLNGHTLSRNGTALRVQDGGTLTLQDSGGDGKVLVTGVTAGSGDAIVIQSGGTFTLESGTIQSNAYGILSGGAATVTGGTVIGGTSVLSAVSSGTIAVSGGWFSHAVNSAYCATGYHPATDTTHTPEYTVSNNWTVTFEMQGHGTAPDAQSVVYGGKATEPTPAPTEEGWTFGGWYKEAACENAWDFSTDTVTANTTLFAKWTASAASISEATVTVRGTYSYTGSQITPEASAITVTLGDATLTYGTDYTFEVSNNTDAGIATVTVTGKGNYKDTATGTFTINKAEVTAPTIASKVYTGSHQTADVTASGLYTVTTNNGGTNVGNYDVVLTLTGSENYKWSNSDAADKTLTFQITKAVTNVITVDVEGWTFGAQHDDPSTTATFGTPVLTYSVRGANSYTNTEPTDAGEYTVKATVAGTDNYVGGEVTKDFTISKADQTAPSGLTATAETVRGKSDGTISGLTTAMEYSSDSGTSYTRITSEMLSDGVMSNLAATTYLVRYAEDANHNASDATSVEIEAGDYLTVTFNSNGGSEVETESVEYNTTVSKPSDPTREGYHLKAWKLNDAAYDFSTPVTSSITLVAEWEINTYKITWVDGDGKTLKTDTVEHGIMPSYSGATPTKTATAQYTYTFNDTWQPAVAVATADQTYTAQFTQTTRKYTITWLNDDDSVIDTTTVEYGTVPTHADPTKAATAEYTYTFAGWSTEPVAVTGPATYMATYTATKNSYTVTFHVNYDELVTNKDPINRTVLYDDKVSAPSAEDLKNVTPAGYAVEGWYTDDSYTTAWIFSSNTVTANISLYAKWGRAAEAEVTYRLVQTGEIETIFEDETFTYFPDEGLVTPEYTYYTFEGWTYDNKKYETSADLQAVLNEKIQNSSFTTFNVTANFKRETYTVKYFSWIQGVDKEPYDEEQPVTTQRLGGSVQVHTVASFENYYFQYWLIVPKSEVDKMHVNDAGKLVCGDYPEYKTVKYTFFAPESDEYYAVAYFGTTQPVGYDVNRQEVALRITNEANQKVGKKNYVAVTLELTGLIDNNILVEAGIFYTAAESADDINEFNKRCPDDLKSLLESDKKGAVTYTMRWTLEDASKNFYLYAYETYRQPDGTEKTVYYTCQNGQTGELPTVYDMIEFQD